MEKKRIWTIIGIVAISLQILLQVLAAIVVLRLNMLPNKYVVVFILAMVVLAECTALFMFIPVKSRIRLWRRIAACVLAALVITGCSIVSKVALDAYRFIRDMVQAADSVNRSYVLVLNENTARTLEDTNGFQYAALEEHQVDMIQQTVTAVEQELGAPIALKYYQQPTVMISDFLNKRIDALIMDGATVSILIDQEGYEDFLTYVHAVHTMTFEIPEAPPVSPQEEVDVKPFAVYISGSDTRSSKLVVSRSDTNILAFINPTNKQILLVNTPRDSYVANPAYKGKLDKLTHCGNNGIDNSIQALELLYGVEVGYYAQVNFTGFEKLIDAVGGITIHSDEDFYTIAGTFIPQGENHFDGKTALEFARERKNVTGGDNGRGKNQMKLIKALVGKMTATSTFISNYAEILGSMEGMFKTNFQTDEISDLVKMQLTDMATWDIQTFAVSGRGSSEICCSWPSDPLSVMIPDEDSVAHAKSLMTRLLNGEVLSEADMIVPKQ